MVRNDLAKNVFISMVKFFCPTRSAFSQRLYRTSDETRLFSSRQHADQFKLEHERIRAPSNWENGRTDFLYLVCKSHGVDGGGDGERADSVYVINNSAQTNEMTQTNAPRDYVARFTRHPMDTPPGQSSWSRAFVYRGRVVGYGFASEPVHVVEITSAGGSAQALDNRRRKKRKD